MLTRLARPPRAGPTPTAWTALALAALLVSLGTREPPARAQPPEALSETRSQKPDTGDGFIDGSIGDASSLIPMLATDASSHDVAGLIYNGLVKYDRDLNLVGDLAESWEVSPDGLEITFHLRHGVRWQDGVEFTAADLLFGLATILDQKTASGYKEDYAQVKEATAPDPYTFRVTYEKPFAPGLASWGMLVVLPKHLLEGKSIMESPLARHPVGTGPYRFVSWKTDERILLEENPDYFDGRPYLDRYVFRVLPDVDSMFLELKAGAIDMMSLSPIQFERQTSTPFFQEKYRKYRYPGNSYSYLGWNLEKAMFQDRSVRRALTMAIDREAIVKGILLGLGSVATGPYPGNRWYTNPAVQPLPYDPERARGLLSEAGWRDTDGDGILDKDGRPFRFTILTNLGNDVRKYSAEMVQKYLSRVGIDARIQVLEWATFINEFVDTKRFDAVLLGWSLGFDPDQYDIWHSSKTGKKELNFVSYKNPEVDSLLERGRRTFDREERKRIYFRFQEILADDQPYTFLYVPEATPIVSARFRGIDPGPVGITWNFDKWWVPKALQRYHSVEP